MKSSQSGQKRRIPLGIFILTVGVLGMLAVVVVCLFTLKFGSFSFLRYANDESEYLTAEQFHVETSDHATITPVPSDTPIPEISAVPTDNSQIDLSTYSTLQFGDENPDVVNLQIRLMALGYMDYDEPSNVFNLSTENAVKLFQRASNLEQTGIATNALQELLFDENAQQYRVKISDDGADVRNAQQRLWELGYYTDKISGYYGPQTEMAVRLFQSRNNIVIDGEITRQVHDILFSDEARALSTATPSPTPTPVPTEEPAATPTDKLAVTAKPEPTPKRTENPPATEKPAATPKPTDAGKTEKPHSTDKPTATPKVTATPKPTKTPKPTATPRVTNSPHPEPGNYGSGISGLIKCAEAQLGDPYLFGASGPDYFDCSGFVCYCMKQAGFSVSRTSSKNLAKNNSWKLIESIDDLKRGDLIFWCSDDSDSVSHVAICTGGRSFIHASASGGCVKTGSIGSSDSNYWYRNFVCGRRFA